MKMAFLRRPVPEERHTHPLLPAQFGRERRTYRNGNRGCHQRHSSQQANFRRHQMHGAATPSRATRNFPVQLSHQHPQIPAFGQVMSVRPVTSKNVILLGQRCAHSSRDCFLACVEVRRTANLLLLQQLCDRLLRDSNPHHGPVHVPQQSLINQCFRGLSISLNSVPHSPPRGLGSICATDFCLKRSTLHVSSRIFMSVPNERLLTYSSWSRIFSGRISSRYVFSGSGLPASLAPSSEFAIEAQSVIPGRTLRMAFSSVLNIATYCSTSGRGPTRLISPFTTFSSCGNSSSL